MELASRGSHLFWRLSASDSTGFVAMVHPKRMSIVDHSAVFYIWLRIAPRTKTVI